MDGHTRSHEGAEMTAKSEHEGLLARLDKKGGIYAGTIAVDPDWPLAAAAIRRDAARITELEAQLEAERLAYIGCNERATIAESSLREVEADNKRLSAGLQWYADGNHYVLEPEWEEEEGWLCPPTDDSWMVDPGNVARAILAGQEMNPNAEDDDYLTRALAPDRTEDNKYKQAIKVGDCHQPIGYAPDRTVAGEAINANYSDTSLQQIVPAAAKEGDHE
jgi:hypothetical protein